MRTFPATYYKCLFDMQLGRPSLQLKNASFAQQKVAKSPKKRLFASAELLAYLCRLRSSSVISRVVCLAPVWRVYAVRLKSSCLSRK